MYSGAILTF